MGKIALEIKANTFQFFTRNPIGGRTKEDSVKNFGYEVLVDDLKRMEYTPYNMYNFHPGSHVGQGTRNNMYTCFLRTDVEVDEYSRWRTDY